MLAHLIPERIVALFNTTWPRNKNNKNTEEEKVNVWAYSSFQSLVILKKTPTGTPSPLSYALFPCFFFLWMDFSKMTLRWGWGSAPSERTLWLAGSNSAAHKHPAAVATLEKISGEESHKSTFPQGVEVFRQESVSCSAAGKSETVTFFVTGNKSKKENVSESFRLCRGCLRVLPKIFEGASWTVLTRFRLQRRYFSRTREYKLNYIRVLIGLWIKIKIFRRVPDCVYFVLVFCCF